jgi:DNA-binding NtrC family response regulator
MNDFDAPTVPQKASLLFVDDEPRVLNAMRAVFKDSYHVTLAISAADALALMEHQHFDVFVSDQRMPGMTGVEFLQLVRKLSPTSVPILLTGYSDVEAVVGAINEVEVHRFMRKPWDNATLRRVVSDSVDVALALRAAAGKAGPVGPMGRAGLVVVDPDPSTHALIDAEFSADYEVIHAPSLLDSLELMETRPFDVLVCTVNVESDTERVFLMQLKQEHPEIIVITMAGAPNSHRLIELINNARIFRFMKWPPDFRLLREYLYSAFDLLRRHKANPSLLRRQAAEPLPEELRKAPTTQEVLKRLRKAGGGIFGK